ncbi:PE family protein [Mycobacterium ulcerans str. Harvey]|uniref:PE family protein n=1 Tax=Mycobacterium ulcerans str. Harvey TaxID=1299332 RepID=A0ABN0R1P4_MYCUL|nr:PE family protein [Mycobacterium ulcerans str. Harvey]
MYVVPNTVAAAAGDLASIRSALSEATAAAGRRLTCWLPAATRYRRRSRSYLAPTARNSRS